MNTQTVGEEIRHRREREGVSQAELARRCGVAQANLSHIERGTRDLTVGTLFKIARALDVDPSNLLDSARPGGAGPDASWASRRGRTSFERIARSVTGEKTVQLSPAESALAKDLRVLIPRNPADRGKSPVVRDSVMYACWARVKSRLDRAALQSLLNRIAKSDQRIHSHAAPAD